MSNNGGTLGRKYQFKIDGSSVGYPVHSEWGLAALDAVAAGYAHWFTSHEVILHQGASIEVIE